VLSLRYEIGTGDAEAAPHRKSRAVTAPVMPVSHSTPAHNSSLVDWAPILILHMLSTWTIFKTSSRKESRK